MERTHPLGSVAQLWRYPVKSLKAEPLERADVGMGGFVGDRRAALFVTTPGHARADKPYRGKEHALLHTVASPGEAQVLAGARAVALAVHDDGPYYDLGDVSLIFDTWLREAEALAATALDPQRFRPNVFALAAPGFSASEATLTGAILAIGALRLEVWRPIERCVTTTYDVATGEAAPHVHAALVRERGNVMGVYCRVIAAGTIARGDAIDLR